MNNNLHYEENYHLNRHTHLYEDNEYYDFRAKMALRLFFSGVKKSSKVLEYGCGLGQNIFRVNNSIGYDVSKFALKFCGKKGIRVTDNLTSLKKYGKFDVVLSCEVLEHLENPFEALKEMSAQLKKGGKLILVLPIDKWNKPSIFDDNQHLYNWNFNTITNLLWRAGFFPVDYKVIRATGFKKLLSVGRLDFELYAFTTKLAAIASGSKHMKIIAIKR